MPDSVSCCAGPDGQSASVYERTMAAFGAIMQFYDPLRSFPLWGFGDQVCIPSQLHLCNTRLAMGIPRPAQHSS